ncbi:hypothetical protein Hanom_Chr00s049003g01778761 [Helianthus anomalus]
MVSFRLASLLERDTRNLPSLFLGSSSFKPSSFRAELGSFAPLLYSMSAGGL